MSLSWSRCWRKLPQTLQRHEQLVPGPPGGGEGGCRGEGRRGEEGEGERRRKREKIGEGQEWREMLRSEGIAEQEWYYKGRVQLI